MTTERPKTEAEMARMVDANRRERRKASRERSERRRVEDGQPGGFWEACRPNPPGLGPEPAFPATPFQPPFQPPGLMPGLDGGPFGTPGVDPSPVPPGLRPPGWDL